MNDEEYAVLCAQVYASCLVAAAACYQSGGGNQHFNTSDVSRVADDLYGRAMVKGWETMQQALHPQRAAARPGPIR